MKRFIITTLLIAATFVAQAQENISVVQESNANVEGNTTISAERIGVKQAKKPRIDREVNKHKFV